MAINVDFAKGAVNSFAPSGKVSYDGDGASFTVAQGGDAPQLGSLFYIMFGRVEITIKAAPGAGIVSSLVLESDDLDEIDVEWLGSNPDEVQSNYFGKGQTTTYNRGQFHGDPARNAPGTVEWARGPTDYAKGPFAMHVRSVVVADYSSGRQYRYRDQSGAWSSIEAVGGAVNMTSEGKIMRDPSAAPPGLRASTPLAAGALLTSLLAAALL
ncbi:hypothetical protein HIM_01818 [Hirsutella minnesotensis 3608]|nr:hypothetical protein HIM_01818 [Hirsutella minnesotensis 3608]